MSRTRIDDVGRAGAILRGLVGTWRGTGQGSFPTIDGFRYREELSFRAHETEPHLHYEQRTWLVSDGEDDGQASHWESGFLMALDDGAVELLNAQQSGRVEVLAGRLFELAGGSFELLLESVVHAHDARMVATHRRFSFGEKDLRYQVEMATDRVAVRQLHLAAELAR